MKILHVTPHLGGGVGKAHAAISAALPKEAVEQTFLLLEDPRDRRYAEMIEAGGARVVIADGLDHVARLAGMADIVQFEFWNHPRLFECLAHTAFPAMRSVFWSHISGLSKPLIQPGLMEEAGRFVFTTEASRSIPSIALLPETARKKISVINSGFGFPDGSRRVRPKNRKPVIAAGHEALRTAAILGWTSTAAPGADGIDLPSLRLQPILDADLMAPGNVQVELINKPRAFAESQRRQRDVR